MDYILEADIYEVCNQLNMLEYSLECVGIDENEFVNEGANIKEKIKNIDKTVLGWIDSARGFLKKILDFVFRKSKVADAAYESAEKKAEQAADNMDKATPEQAESKDTKTVSNIMRITINTQKVGEFLASAQQNIHVISSCINSMDKLFKSLDFENPEKNNYDKFSKSENRFSEREIAVRYGLHGEYYNPAKAFLEDETYTIQELSKGKRKIHKEIIQVINTNKKYIDSIQDRLEKIISQSDKELAKVRQKVQLYVDKIHKMEGRKGYHAYGAFGSDMQFFRKHVTRSNEIINTSAQFVIKYKVTLAGYLSAIAAGSSSEVA